MLKMFITWHILFAIISLIIGGLILLFFRLTTKNKAMEKTPAGLWARAACFGLDFVLIEILTLLLAYYGTLRATGFISLLILVSYFVLFWVFFSATPAMMFTRIRLITDTDTDKFKIKFWQALVRFLGFIILIFGWVTALFDRKKKREFQDFISKTRMIYTNDPLTINNTPAKLYKLLTLGAVGLLLISLIIGGLGEKITDYKETKQIMFFDIDKNGVPDGILIDSDDDGQFESVKYDLSNDGIIEFTTYDTDLDGISESMDLNNDGRIDGFDFNNDFLVDKKLNSGYVFIWAGKTWFTLLLISLLLLTSFIIYKERKE